MIIPLCYLCFSTLSLSLPLASAQGDFDWAISPLDGYPLVNFNHTSSDREIVFAYNFTGNLSDDKFFNVHLFQIDCVAPADESLVVQQSIEGDELTVDVDVIIETITGSVHFSMAVDSNASAVIEFCLRVDYMFDMHGDDELASVNFHETRMTIDIDLAANFSITELGVDFAEALEGEKGANVDYPVEAYFCHADNTEVQWPAPLAQGVGLRFCVRTPLNETLFPKQDVYVDEILTTTLSQNGTSSSTIIANMQPDALTKKACREMGICNIVTQLTSKFFQEEDPAPIVVDGVAILAFGKASSMPSLYPAQTPVNNVRRLRVPIHAKMRQTRDFANGDRELSNDVKSPFDLRVLLDTMGINVTANVTSPDDQSEEAAAQRKRRIIIASVVTASFAAAGLLLFIAWRRRGHSEQTEGTVARERDSSEGSGSPDATSDASQASRAASATVLTIPSGKTGTRAQSNQSQTERPDDQRGRRNQGSSSSSQAKKTPPRTKRHSSGFRKPFRKSANEAPPAVVSSSRSPETSPQDVSREKPSSKSSET